MAAALCRGRRPPPARALGCLAVVVALGLLAGGAHPLGIPCQLFSLAEWSPAATPPKGLPTAPFRAATAAARRFRGAAAPGPVVGEGPASAPEGSAAAAVGPGGGVGRWPLALALGGLLLLCLALARPAVRAVALLAVAGQRTAVASRVPRISGTCVRWIEDRGFGFIQPDDGQEPVFVHHVDILSEGFRELGIGERVEFQRLTDLDGRPQARDVTGPGGVRVAGPAWWGVRVGTVASWRIHEGFGWIRPDDGSADVFVHQREVFAGRNGFRALQVGLCVEFRTLTDGAGRPFAAKVTAPQGQPIEGMLPPEGYPLEKLRHRTPRKQESRTKVDPEWMPHPDAPELPPVHCRVLSDTRIRIKTLDLPRLRWPVVDVGVNLTHPKFNGKEEGVLERAWWGNVRHMVIHSSSLASTKWAIELAGRFPALLSCTAGVDPLDAPTLTPAVLEEFRRLLDDPDHRPRVVAVGPSGLDLKSTEVSQEAQEAALRQQATLAMEKGLPLLVCHGEGDGAPERTIDILTECNVDWSRVCIHRFNGPEEQLMRYIQLGCHIAVNMLALRSLRGNPLRLLIIAGLLPLDRLLLASDAPYLHPVPEAARKRKASEPCFLPAVARAVARCYPLRTDELARATTRNAVRFFGLRERLAPHAEALPTLPTAAVGIPDYIPPKPPQPWLRKARKSNP